MRVTAIIGGLDVPVLPGLEAGEPATPALVNVRRVLTAQLAPEHRAGAAELLDSPSRFTARALRTLLTRARQDPPDRLWIVLAGEVVECLGDPYLTTSDVEPSEPGLPLARFVRLVNDAGVSSVCVVLDTGRAQQVGRLPDEASRWTTDQIVGALRDLRCDLLAIGPGVVDRLGAALLSPFEGERGPVAAGVVADKLLGADTIAHGTSAPLNVAAGEVAPTTEEGRRDAVVRLVLTGVQERTSSVLFDLAKGSDGPIPLESVYVRTIARAAEGERKRDKRNKGNEEEKKEETTTLHDLVAAHPRLLIVGDPGGGKTTFLRRLAHLAATATLDCTPPIPGLPDRAVPLLVRLEDYGRRCRSEQRDPCATTLRSFLLEKLVADGAQVAAPVGEALWRERRLVLMLDGLDEVPDPDRRKLLADAIAELASSVGDMRILVTCRPAALRAGIDVGARFEQASIAPLDEDLQAEFVRRWMVSRHGEDAAAEVAGRLLSELRSNDRLAAELQSPLLLTIVCVLYWEDGQLPTGRAELYKALVALLLADRRKGDVFGWRQGAPDAWTRWRAAAEIAYRHRVDGRRRKDGTALIGKALIREAVAAHVTDPVVAEDLVDFLEQRSGLLEHAGQDHGGEPLYDTPHRTLIEYLTASHLGGWPTTKAVALLVSRAADADWREVTLLWVLCKTDDPSSPTEPVETLIEALVECGARLASPDAACARLAAECLAERRGMRELERTSRRVDGTLQPILADRSRSVAYPEAERVAFWLAIGMNDRRLSLQNRWVDVPGGWAWRGQVPGDEEAHDVEKPGRPVRVSRFMIQRWPVLVAEYAAFVDPETGGYRDPIWWHPDGWKWCQEEASSKQPGGWHDQRRKGNTPVTGVCWWEAHAFCAWATERLRAEWSIPADWEIRLPTEAEWEAACRVRGASPIDDPSSVCVDIYPWGSERPHIWRAAFDGRLKSAPPVGAWPAGSSKGLGLFDMTGCVWEWCLDAWSLAAYGSEGQIDPLVLTDGGHSVSRSDPRECPRICELPPARRRVVRGGSISDWAWGLRASFRGHRDPSTQIGDRGFRCVVSLPAQVLAP